MLFSMYCHFIYGKYMFVSTTFKLYKIYLFQHGFFHVKVLMLWEIFNCFSSKNFHLITCWPDKIRGKMVIRHTVFFSFVSLNIKKAKREIWLWVSIRGIQYISALIVLKSLRSFGFVSPGDGYSESPRLSLCPCLPCWNGDKKSILHVQ